MKLHFKKKFVIKTSKIGLLYILSMAIIQIHQAGIFPGYYLTPFIFGVFWFALAMVYRNFKFGTQDIDKVFLLLFVPWITFILYNIFLFSFGIGYAEFIKSSFVQILFTPCILLGAWAGYTFFQKNTLRYILYSTVIQYVVVLIYQLIDMGPIVFINGTLTIFTGNSIGNPFETNSDVLLALGILIIYTLYYREENQRLEKINGLLIALLFFLGGKRICILALLAIIAYMFFSITIIERKRNIIQNIVSVLFILCAYGFIYLLDSGILSAFVWSKGVNTMGRMNMWDYISEFLDFNFSFLGHGYSFCNLLLERDRIYTFEGHVYALHSDILKIFVEFGFVVFGVWLVYNLIFLPSKLREKYGFRVSNFVWMTTIYLFMLYFTDNAINYYVTQTVYVVVIMNSIFIEHKKTR